MVFCVFFFAHRLGITGLDGNRIRFVNDVFDILPNLRFLTFNKNQRGSWKAKDDRIAVLELMKKIHQKCGIDYKKTAQQCKKDKKQLVSGCLFI